MAYKFQLGAFTADGAINADGFDAQSQDITSVETGSFSFLSASGDLEANGILLNDASGLLDPTGVLIESSGALDVAVDDSSIEKSAGSIQVKALGITNAMLAGSIENAKLSNSTISGIALGTNLNSLSADAAGAITLTSYNGAAAVSDLSVNVDDSSIEKFSNNLRIKGLGVTNAMLAGSIENSKLLNQSVSFGGVSLNLGQTDATPAFDLADATNYPGDNSLVTVGALDAGSITSNFGSINVGSSAISTTGTGSFGKVVISGDLEVQGTTTQVDTTNLNVADKNILINDGGSTAGSIGAGIDIEGDSAAVVGYMKVDTASNEQLIFKAPGGSILTLDMDANGEIQFDAAKKLTVGGDFNIDADISATAAEINILDGGSADSGITILDSDQLIINDGGTMVQTAMTDLKAYVELGFNPAINVALKADGDTLNTGVNYFADMGSDGTDAVTLPASPSVGQSVKVKAPSDCSANRKITINRAGSQTIDGATLITLESPFAAVELVYVASDLWRVF